METKTQEAVLGFVFLLIAFVVGFATHAALVQDGEHKSAYVPIHTIEALEGSQGINVNTSITSDFEKADTNDRFEWVELKY